MVVVGGNACDGRVQFVRLVSDRDGSKYSAETLTSFIVREWILDERIEIGVKCTNMR